MARAWTMGIGRAAGLQGLLKGLSKGYTRPHSRDRCRLSYCELVGLSTYVSFFISEPPAGNIPKGYDGICNADRRLGRCSLGPPGQGDDLGKMRSEKK